MFKMFLSSRKERSLSPQCSRSPGHLAFHSSLASSPKLEDCCRLVGIHLVIAMSVREDAMLSLSDAQDDKSYTCLVLSSTLLDWSKEWIALKLTHVIKIMNDPSPKTCLKDYSLFLKVLDIIYRRPLRKRHQFQDNYLNSPSLYALVSKQNLTSNL